MSPLQGSGILFSLGQQRSCESERNISKLFSQILQGTFQKKPNSKAVAWLYFPVADTEHKSLPILPRDMRSQYRWGVGEGGGVTFKCGRRGVGCGQSSLHFIIEEMAPQKWAATSQLPHGGWQWSPRMNTSLIKANEAFFASSACAEKNNDAPPPPPPSSLRVHTLHTWNVESEWRWQRKRVANKKKNSIWFHSPLTRSLTDGDLPPLNKGKETAWSRRHKTAQSGC